jgi:trehalose synthase
MQGVSFLWKPLALENFGSKVKFGESVLSKEEVKMFDAVSVGELSLDDYNKIVGKKEVDSIRALAEEISSDSVCHVNSTSFGGGVAEILHRLVPLMNDVGLDTDWKVPEGTVEFFNVTKAIHNALQGMKTPLTDEMKRIYLRRNETSAGLLDLGYDYVVIHDPQPLPITKYYHERTGKWIWRCHIDLSRPNKDVLGFLAPFIEQYDAAIFTLKEYAERTLRIKRLAVIPPSIDPLSDKNKPLSESQILSVLDRYDVNPEKPIITQVARFDPWKDPLGVIDAYRIVKRKIPQTQLLLIASMAPDDPEGWVYYEKTTRRAGEDYDIHVLTDLIGVHNLEVNAFQRGSDVVLQKSTREGFGLSVTEALWKEVPVVGGNVGGIPLQIKHGVSGFLVSTVKEAAEKTLYLLRHPERAKEMGKKGRDHVLRNFLITRHLKDYIELFIQLSDTKF